MGAVKQEFYTDADLQIGNVINVWGRPLKLVACDEFTQQFYKEKYEVDAFVKLENKAIPKKAPGNKFQISSALRMSRNCEFKGICKTIFRYCCVL